MSFKSIFWIAASVFLFVVVGCEEPEPVIPPFSGNFTITIENVYEEKEFLDSGATGILDSAETETFLINAGVGHRLSLVVGTDDFSDLFFATSEEGIDLYPGGTPLEGEVSSQMEIFDAGVFTELGTNEMELVASGSSFPVGNFMEVNIVHNGGTEFAVTLENVLTEMSVFDRVGEGVWLIHDEDQLAPIFTVGDFASDELSDLAGFNTNNSMNNFLAERSGFFSTFSPGAYAMNDSLFNTGIPASSEIESLAEDADPSGFSNTFTIPVGSTAAASIAFGESYEFTLEGAVDGDFFALATMMEETNDLFVGANFIPLFHNGLPLTGEITSIMRVWDAGTEVDEFPGIGVNQAPRQSGVNVGPNEGAMLERESSESFEFPEIHDIIKVTLVAN